MVYWTCVHWKCWRLFCFVCLLCQRLIIWKHPYTHARTHFNHISALHTCMHVISSLGHDFAWLDDACSSPTETCLTSMQVSTTAKRTFTGCLMCIDHFGNLLIFDAFEDMSTGDHVHDRRLNHIIVPLNTVQDAQVLVRHLSYLRSQS